MKNFLKEYENSDITIINYTDNSSATNNDTELEYVQNTITSENGNQLYIDNLDNILFLYTNNHIYSLLLVFYPQKRDSLVFYDELITSHTHS